MSAAPRILIADDDPTVRLIACAVVERAGMSPVEAADGSEALAVLDSGQSIDLVLLDLDMPMLSGLDVLRAIRGRPVPVLVMTGAEGTDVQTALSLGAKGIIAKPLAAEKLLGRIREMLG